MDSVFNWIRRLGPAGLVLKAIVVSLVGIGLLIGLVVVRRWYRGRYFRRRNARTLALRRKWEDIVSGPVPPETWRFDRLDCEIVETILLDCLEVAPDPEVPRLLQCLRSSGLLDMRIYEARAFRGWRRRAALVALGRMRAPEAIPALAEGLKDRNLESRVAAVRGLSRTASPNAAVHILDLLVDGLLPVPALFLKNALLNCCRSNPELLVTYLRKAEGGPRELLARVLGELATPELGDELLVLAADPLPEVRAAAARALGRAKPHLSLRALSALAADSEWFVRLRAVVALSALASPTTIPVLIRALCDANLYVRHRAAWALVRLEPYLQEILEQVVEISDDYALLAMISELERSGRFQKLLRRLEEPSQGRTATAILLDALREGQKRLQGGGAVDPKPEEVAR